MSAAKSIIRQMLETQDRLNRATIGKDWQLGKEDFCLAIVLECAEGIEHIGYKWWAKQTSDMDGARGEVVDILHFALAQLIREKGLNSSTAEEYINKGSNSIGSLVVFGHKTYDTAKLRHIQLFRLVSGLAAMEQISFAAIFTLAERLGLPFPVLLRHYFCKATLNQFRQDHGYKEGSYEKLWWGKEDNHFIRKAADALDWKDGASPYKLYAYLEVTYEKALRQEDEPVAGNH